MMWWILGFAVTMAVIARDLHYAAKHTKLRPIVLLTAMTLSVAVTWPYVLGSNTYHKYFKKDDEPGDDDVKW